MNLIWLVVLFWIFFEITDFFILQEQSEKLEKKPWPKEYAWRMGVVWVIGSMSYKVLNFVFKKVYLDRTTEVMIIVIFLAPLIIYGIYIDRKYKNRLTEEKDKENT